MSSFHHNILSNVLSSFSPNYNALYSSFIPAKIDLINPHILKFYKTPCSICLNKINNPFKINPCNHLFCKNCINSWKKFNNSCPICRSIIINLIKNK